MLQVHAHRWFNVAGARGRRTGSSRNLAELFFSFPVASSQPLWSAAASCITNGTNLCFCFWSFELFIPFAALSSLPLLMCCSKQKFDAIGVYFSPSVLLLARVGYYRRRECICWNSCVRIRFMTIFLAVPYFDNSS